MARAPQAIYKLFADIKAKVPKAVLSGIVGDVEHSYGYHLARNQLPRSDYSVQLAADREGAADCASALDINLPPDLMKIVTARLVAAAKRKDPRLKALREFCGTLNGTVTHPWQLTPTNGPEGAGTWDDSHLWHIHLSILREYADDYDALAPIADVIAGIDPEEFTMDAAAKAAFAAQKTETAALKAQIASLAKTVNTLVTTTRFNDVMGRALRGEPDGNLKDIAAAVNKLVEAEAK